MNVLEEVKLAAQYEAKCWAVVEAAARMGSPLDAYQADHAQAVGALLLLTRLLVAGPTEVAGEPVERPYDPLRPERHLRRIPEPPPPIVVPPVVKDPMTVSLTDNQWLELGRLMRGPCPPMSPFRAQLQKILVEARLAWPAEITGCCVISDDGKKRFKAGRFPPKTPPVDTDKVCAPCSHGDHGKCRDSKAGGSGILGFQCHCCYPPKTTTVTEGGDAP